MRKSAIFLLAITWTTAVWAGEGRTTSSFSRLMESDQSLVCTFTQAGLAGSTKGTTYTAKGKMRGDFELTQPGVGPVAVHVVHNKEWHYLWGGLFGANKGLKVPSSQAGSHLVRGEKTGPGMDETLSLDCKPWPPNALKFKPPTEVLFEEMAPPLERVPDAAEAKKSRCAACEQAPQGPSREDCRRSLGCA